MNKNFIFLLLPLLALTTQVFTQDSTRRRKREHDAEEQRQDKQEQQLRREHQKQERDQRADRREGTKATITLADIREQHVQASSEATCCKLMDLCFANQFDAAATYIQEETINLTTLTDSRGYNILQIACELYPFADDENIDLPAILVFLIEQGANPNHRNTENQTILHVTCQNDLGQQAHAVLDLILQHLDPALINSIDNHGRHALHYACINSSDATDYFIQHNIGQAFFLHRDHQNMTPLDLAVVSNSNQLTELVNFRAGAGDDGFAGLPLHWAAQNNMTSVVSGLIRNGHNVNAASQNGVTALHIAVRNDHIATVHALLERSSDIINTANQFGLTVLHLATQYGCLAAAQALLATQSINVNAQSNNRNTPLHFAANHGHTAIVQALLEHGADINIANQNSDTALHIAAERGHTETVQALLAATGINVNAATRMGITALHLAARLNNTEIVQTLLERDADTSLLDNDGRTPADVACTPEIRQLILDAAARQQ